MRKTKLSPAEFTHFKLGIKDQHDWQIDCLEAIGLQDGEGGLPVSLVAANGSGKTARIVAPAVLWFLSKYPQGQVIITSGSFRQVEKQLWPALKSYRKSFPQLRFLNTELKNEEEGFAYGFSTDDANKAEGWHPKISPEVDPVFIIVDEAKSVKPDVFEAFDRCTRLIQLWVSSPGEPRGQFYDSHHKDSADFWTRKVSSFECPHIKAEKREKDLRKYGEDHPTYRSMHLAEFTDVDGRYILSPGELQEALDSQPDKDETGRIVAFCDFAAGRDENCLAIRRGNSVRIIKAWVEKDTMQAAREFVRLFKENALKPHQVFGDADGLGTVMIDALAELGYPINQFHGNAKPKDENYRNAIAEAWHKGAAEIKRGLWNLGQLDQKSFEQMTTRKSEWTDDGKLRCESKEKMAKQGIKSPDRPDTIFGAMYCDEFMTKTITAEAAEASVIDPDFIQF